MGDFLHFILNLDEGIRQLITDFGPWVYGIVALTIFCETGLVVTPFLPGDSLLFALGMFSNPAQEGSKGVLNVWILFFLLIASAFAGDNVNYQIGKRAGARLFRNEKSRYFKKSNLEKTHAFFEKYGGWTLVLARFVPVVRTFAPFVAGMGAMTYRAFLAWSFGGAVFWVGTCLFAGYLFGQIPWVQANFDKVMLIFLVVTTAPIIWKVWQARREAAAAPSVQ